MDQGKIKCGWALSGVRYSTASMLMFCGLGLSPQAGAQTVIVDTTTGIITGDDGSNNSFNGTPFLFNTVGGTANFYLQGDLVIGDNTTVIIQGSRPASFRVGNDLRLGTGVVIDASANGITAGPGGGVGGTGGIPGIKGFGGTGGDNLTLISSPFFGDRLVRTHGIGGTGGVGGEWFGRSSEDGTAGTAGEAGTPGTNGTGGFAGLPGLAGFGSSSSVGGLGGQSGGVANGVGLGGKRGDPFPGGTFGENGGLFDGAGGHGGNGGFFGSGEDPNFYIGDPPLSAPGGVGGQGGNGLGGTYTGTGDQLVAGSGGGGGGGGTGGGGGGGGSGGSGGGGGGGATIGSVGLFNWNGGSGGDGGDGGAGGDGGDGGNGGFGGRGGAGAGAFEIIAQGQIIAPQFDPLSQAPSLLAVGGDGQAGQSGSPGMDGTLGTEGTDRELGEPSPSNGDVFTYPGGQGGDGGLGGYGGMGRWGGDGGDGGTGGGGAGGTIKLIASAGTGTIQGSVSPGLGGEKQGHGSVGRVLESFSAGDFDIDLDISNSIDLNAGGPTQLNPFTGELSPLLPGLEQGAEAFGLMTIEEALIDQWVEVGEAALVRLDFVPAGLSADDQLDFLGHDLLLLVNRSGQALLDPMLAVDGNSLEELVLGGWTRDAAFGGAGDETLATLLASEIYATLIPEQSADFEVQLNGFTTQGELVNAGTLSLAVPEPSSIAMLGAPGLLLVRRRR